MTDRENAAIQFAADKLGINREKFSHRIIWRQYYPRKWTWTATQKGNLVRIDVVFENEQETFGLGVMIGPFASTDGSDMRCVEIDYAV